MEKLDRILERAMPVAFAIFIGFFAVYAVGINLIGLGVLR